MAAQNATRAAPGVSGNGPLGTGELSGSLDSETKVQTQATSHWRQQYRVHPVAGLFPMMSDDELAKLGEDIKTSGLRSSIVLSADGILLDGRNRLEAMERAGVAVQQWHTRTFDDGDPVAFIVSSNIRRRHLTKEQQADLIVTAHKATAEAADKPRQLGEVSAKGGRAKVNTMKAAAVATAKEHGISKRTVERSFAKVERRLPEPKKIAGSRPRRKPKLETHVGIDAARRYYLEQCAEPDVDLDAEQEIIIDALHEIAGKRAIQAPDDDLGNIPAGLDRRRQP